MKRMYVAALVVLILDQASKFIVVQVMNLKSVGEIDVLPPFLSFHMAWNPGINFGLFDVSRWVLIAVALGISLWVFIWVRREAHRPWVAVSGGFLIGGALGNVLDRLVYGKVADFLNMTCCGIDNPYAFNVADVMIFVGAIGLVIFTSDGKGDSAREAE